MIESGLGDGVEKWEQIYDRIANTLSLLSPGGPVPEFLLHIQGDKAWFRWSDKPFDN